LLNKILAAWVLAILVFTHVSCKKDTGSVGLQPGDDDNLLLSQDTFTLVTRTVREDSFRISQPFVSYQLLGATQSNTYGYNAAATWVSFALPKSNFSFPAGMVIDSVVLQLKYLDIDQYNGNLNTPMAYRVSEITERMSSDSIYFSRQEFTTNNTFTNSPITPKLSDSVDLTENGVSTRYAPHLRLQVDPSVEAKMLNATATDLTSNQSFQDYFNGLKIDVEGQNLVDGQGNVVYLNLQNSLSGLAVYFNDTGKYLFPINQAVRLSTFKNEYSATTDVLTQLNSSAGTDFTETYLQSMSGLKTQIDIPHLLDLTQDGSYAVVNAQIIFEYDASATGSDFPAPDRLLLLKRDSSGRNAFVSDQVLEPNLYGGSKTDDDKYIFTISREIQSILNNYKNTGLNTNTGFYLIIPADNPVSATRLKMTMNKNSSPGVKFKITLIKSD